MSSAIILAILNAAFMGITMFYGAWYALSARGSDKMGTAMPLLLMLPRFFLAIGSFAIGVILFDWNTEAVVWFITLLGGLWILLVTAEIFYVQYKLRGRKYEKQEVEDVQSKSIPIPYRTGSDSALIAYEARKRSQLW